MAPGRVLTRRPGRIRPHPSGPGEKKGGGPGPRRLTRIGTDLRQNPNWTVNFWMSFSRPNSR